MYHTNFETIAHYTKQMNFTMLAYRYNIKL